MSSIFNMPWTQAFDASGNTLAGAKLYFYAAGTSTLQNVYADSELTTALSNPVVANGGGRFAPIYLADSAYKVALYTADDVLIWTADNVIGNQSSVDGTFGTQAVKSVITAAGLSDEDSSNFAPAVFKYASAATYYTDTGTTANLYVLQPVGDYDTAGSAAGYFDGMTIKFVTTRASTGTNLVQVNVNGKGAKYVRRSDGSNLKSGDIYGLVEMVYNGVYFLLKPGTGMTNSNIDTANIGACTVSTCTVSTELNIPGGKIWIA